MSNETITVKADIRLLSPEEGGRDGPITGSFRPNHNFFTPDGKEMTIGFVEVPEGQVLNPGESMQVVIRFLNWPGLVGQIYPGRQWHIQEGPALIGIGTVLEVL